ncbi:MAG TPA: LacI family DNA-binding transcriptional regulator [Candidatus Limnocylindria bacterium]|nr:LacI family DNA-binding transcriptional regulator [Candidatus Limnocylindria bacterium]
MSAHHPHPAARRQADVLAARIGTDLDTARMALVMAVEDVARRARVSPSTVARVLRGDGGVHLDTLCAVTAAVGMKISVKAYPTSQPSLRDSGQLRIAEYLVAQAHASLRPALEVPVGDPFGRAADVVFFGPDEILHSEIERGLPDFQAPHRAAMLKRDALQQQHARPVRLILVIEDTTRNRRLVSQHAPLIHHALPAGSAQIMRAIRNGTPLGSDGLLWVRPWRDSPGARRASGAD